MESSSKPLHVDVQVPPECGVQSRVTVKAGTQERGTERGTEVKCGPRAIITCTVRAGRLYSLDWTGLTQKSVFQCRTEANHT